MGRGNHKRVRDTKLPGSRERKPPWRQRPARCLVLEYILAEDSWPRPAEWRHGASPSCRVASWGGRGICRPANGYASRGSARAVWAEAILRRTPRTVPDIVALCDVDDQRAAGSFAAFPKASRYKDFRRMFDNESKRIDAVTVGTPDHIHAVATAAAIRAGKHVYCQKPLTHTLVECRTVTQAARAAGVMTQMGNQGHATEGARLTNEWIQAGVIGEIREVHSWCGGAPSFDNPYRRDRPGKTTQRSGRISLDHHTTPHPDHSAANAVRWFAVLATQQESGDTQHHMGARRPPQRWADSTIGDHRSLS